MAVRNVSQSGTQKQGSTLTDEQRLEGNKARAKDFVSICAKDESNNIDLDGMNDVIGKAPHPSKLPSARHASDPTKTSDDHCKACEQTPWGQEHCEAHNMKTIRHTAHSVAPWSTLSSSSVRHDHARYPRRYKHK
eukprot:SAG11_NODE_5444_length_1558_cov_1.759424_3_plen_135_part_00